MNTIKVIFQLRILILLGLSGLTVTAYSAEILVLYPEIREPYRQVFTKINEGIELSYKGTVTTIIIEKNQKPDRIQERINQKSIDGIIALGKRSLNITRLLTNKPPTIGGAIITNPLRSKVPSISLIPDPYIMIKNLKDILPNTKRIYTVYDPGSDNWLMERAKEAATAYQIELIANKAADAKEMAQYYKDYTQSMNSETDLLWLAPNGVSLEWAVMQDILERSWKSDLKLFSSNLSDIKKGVLFSFMPDNIAMGSELVQLLSNVSKEQKTESAIPVKSLGMAVNLRTADHLNLNFSEKTLNTFSYMHPPPRR